MIVNTCVVNADSVQDLLGVTKRGHKIANQFDKYAFICNL